jgi:hypothetical protein
LTEEFHFPTFSQLYIAVVTEGSMPNLLAFWPHTVLILCGWCMTLSPGSLFFHHLCTVEVFSENFESRSFKFELSLSAAQVVSLPYVRHLFYTVSVPCFGLFFYFFTLLISPAQPDLLLFLISVVPTILTCARITFSMPLFSAAAAFFSALSFVFSRMLVMAGAVEHSGAVFLHCAVLVQFAALAHTAVSRALTYFRYTHPRAGLLDLEVFHPILRTVYSTRAHVLMTLWHHADLGVVLIVVGAKKFFGEAVATRLLVFGALASVGLTFLATKYVLQLRIIDLLLPCIKKGTPEKGDVNKVIKPIGAIAFGMIAAAAVQALLLVGMLFCRTFPSAASDFYGSLLRALLFTGSVLGASARVASWALIAHPIESERCGYKL